MISAKASVRLALPPSILFPAAMASYMFDRNMSAIYIKVDVVDGELKVVPTEIPIRDVFNAGNRTLEDLHFSFESTFEPYQQYSFDAIDGIDLVMKDTDGNYLAPLEVKLTVLPTSQTSTQPEDKWGSEIVVRSATTSYCALGMFDAVKHDDRC